MKNKEPEAVCVCYGWKTWNGRRSSNLTCLKHDPEHPFLYILIFSKYLNALIFFTDI